MGEEYAALDMVPGDSLTTKSHLQFLLLELELGLVAVSTCVGVDCMVIAIVAPSAPLGTCVSSRTIVLVSMSGVHRLERHDSAILPLIYCCVFVCV